MNRLDDDLDTWCEMAHQEYEITKPGAGHRVTIGVVAKRYGLTEQKLKDWRERNTSPSYQRRRRP